MNLVACCWQISECRCEGAGRLTDNCAMSAAFDKPSFYQRTLPLLQGFDGLMAFAVFLLACAGLLIMYSSGS